jgi:hypothetical protein
MPVEPVEQLLFQWGTGSRVETDDGPPIDPKACSAEGCYRSPQPWDDDARRRPRISVIDDERAMLIAERVAALLCVPACPLQATVQPRSRAADAGARVAVSPDPFWR